METKEITVITTVNMKNGEIIELHNVVDDVPKEVPASMFFRESLNQLNGEELNDSFTGLNKEGTALIAIPRGSINYISISVEE